MSKLNSFPISRNLSYEKPDLLKSYPDIDYEMIPIQDNDNFSVGISKTLPIAQLPFLSIKNYFKSATQFNLTSNSSSEIASHLLFNISQKKEIKCIAIDSKTDHVLFLPLQQMSCCKKTKKFTKFSLHNGEQLKTSLNFKKLKKTLLRNGFIEIKKSHLVPLRN